MSVVGPIEVVAAAGAFVAFDPVKRALGPTADYIGEQLKATVEKQWNKIVEKANNKIAPEDEKMPANLRLTTEIIRNGTTIDSDVAAEYLGGILAGSKSDSGSDDSGITYLAAIRSMSTHQLQLHYIIYRAMNQLLINNWPSLNLGKNTDLEGKLVYLPTLHLTQLGMEPARELQALHREGVISRFRYDNHMLENNNQLLPYCSVGVTTYGFMLFAAAHNNETNWRMQSSIDLGKMDSAFEPTMYASSLEELVTKAQVTS